MSKTYTKLTLSIFNSDQCEYPQGQVYRSASTPEEKDIVSLFKLLCSMHDRGLSVDAVMRPHWLQMVHGLYTLLGYETGRVEAGLMHEALDELVRRAEDK